MCFVSAPVSAITTISAMAPMRLGAATSGFACPARPARASSCTPTTRCGRSTYQISRSAPGGAFPTGSLGWTIARYKLKAPQWKEAAVSTREIYERRFAWLTDNYGGLQMAAFDGDMLREIRDLPEFDDKPSVADATVERFAHVWDFAREYLRADMRLAGLNPGRHIKKAHRGEGESAPLWPLELCRKFEALENCDLVTFYYLARYTGQRRSDLAQMRWDDIAGDEMYVAQIKTSAKIWVPMPKPLRDYLANWPMRGPFIVMSPKGRGKPTVELTRFDGRVGA